jgi:hypothetical protein
MDYYTRDTETGEMKLTKLFSKNYRSPEQIELEDKISVVKLEYNTLLRKYYHNNIPKGRFKFEGQYKRHWSKIIELAEVDDIPLELFVKAQFYWFDKWFVKAPEVYEMCSTKSSCNSVVRARSYNTLIQSGLVRDKNILYKAFPAPTISDSRKNKYFLNILRDMMKKYQLSAEEVLVRFNVIFDQTWLRNNPQVLETLPQNL